MIPRYALFVTVMLMSLLPIAKAEPNLSAEMKFALATRDAVLNLINTSLKDEGKPLVQCSSVEYYVEDLPIKHNEIRWDKWMVGGHPSLISTRYPNLKTRVG